MRLRRAVPRYTARPIASERAIVTLPLSSRMKLFGLLPLVVLPSSFADGPIRQFEPAELSALGRAIYEQERRIAIASEFLAQNFDPRGAGVFGWVTEGASERLLVRFVRNTEHGAEAVFDARFDGMLLPTIAAATNPALTATQRAQLAARDTVGPHLAHPCSDRYDSVILPDPEREGLLVYALAVASEPAQVMLGGHYRFSVSADGTRLLHVDTLSTSCAVVPKAELEAASAAGGDRGLGLRAPLSDSPLETHVLQSLRLGVPLFVMTRDQRLWRVDGDSMSVLKAAPGAPAAQP